MFTLTLSLSEITENYSQWSPISFSTTSAHQIIFQKETFQTNNWPFMVKMNLGLWRCWNLAELEIAIAERKLKEIVKKEYKIVFQWAEFGEFSADSFYYK